MNKARAFTWKALGLGPHFQVEVADSVLTLHRNGRPSSIPLVEIQRVYFQVVNAAPMLEQLHVELVAESGKGVEFHAANRGGSTADLDACRGAAAAVLDQLAVVNPSVGLYLGGRPDKPLRFVVLALVLFALAGLIWLVTFVLTGDATQASSFAGFLAVCFFFGTVFTFRKAKKAQRVSPEEVFRQLATP